MGIPDGRKANSLVGRSKRSRYRADAKVRHDQRYGSALRDIQIVERDLGLIGVSLKLNNSGHHWVFSNDDGSFAEWWPSSAKLVFDRKYHRGIHTHGSDQLVALITDYLKEIK